MKFKEQIDKRLKNNVIEMTASLSYAINKSDKKPTIETSELIKALTEGIANLLKVIEDEPKGDETSEKKGRNSKR